MYVQQGGGIESLAFVQQDEDLETHSGAIKTVWMYSNTQVTDNNWLEGQVEIRADVAPPDFKSKDEFIQNYTVSM